jgi:excisionase family DNA binding protein
MAEPKRSDTRETGQEPMRFLTVSEVAKTLRVSSMTVYRLVNSGQLDAVRVGRSYRIRESDLQRYLEQRYMDAG